jgi:uncharacterized radical SAM protein YgiQ
MRSSDPGSRLPQPRFLPVSRDEADELGIRTFDIIFVTGDAYVDHPSFATALLGRVLWDAGFTVGVIAQPEWRSDRSLSCLGTPRLFFAISSGNVDSMVNHYTASLKQRSGDVYSSGGALVRPDRAAIVYTDRIHALFPETPVVIGGVEASLRRFAHYDYWSDRVRHGLLADAPADLLVFGMGERQLLETALRLSAGEPPERLIDIPGTVYRKGIGDWRGSDHSGHLVIPSFAEVSTSKEAYARAFALHYQEQDPYRGRPVVQVHPKTVIIQNLPALPLSSGELDYVYELPYTRKAHPCYREPVPALEPVAFSITSHRGCFGGCAFCALAHHQGRFIQSRSEDSIVREAERFVTMPGFRGVIQDVGGPTANMFGASCEQWTGGGTCPDRSCLPGCPNLRISHARQIHLLRRLRAIPGVKRVFIGSGIRYDLLMADPAPYLEEICAHHVSGHLKVAPEHIVPHVTATMRKSGPEVFDRFRIMFEEIQAGKKKRQYLVPYFMSGHPGCTIPDMVAMALYIRDHRMYSEQVQDFTPTPMSLATCMYYTGLDPFTLQPVHVPKGREKQIQRALLHFREPKNRTLVEEGLAGASRRDLIGPGPGCLIPAVPEITRKKGKFGKE